MAKLLKQQDGVVSFDIFINGSKIKDVIEILEISVQMEVNRISSATLLMVDGGAIGLANEPFDNSEGEDFVPGNQIKIALGYNDKKDTVFEGIIVSQGLTVKNGTSQLLVTCKDKAVKMTKGRFNALFTDQKDSEAITSIAGNYGLQTDIESTKHQFTLMQYNCSDWDFVVIRAESNNMIVLTDKNKLIVKKVDFSASPAFEINASQFIIDVDLNLDSENIPESFELTAWDIKEQKEVKESVSLTDGPSQGNISVKKLSAAGVNGKSNHYSSGPLTSDELKLWGQTLADKAALSKIQGKITIPGTSGILGGDLISLAGFSARFNGNAFVSKVSHFVEAGEWITTLTIGKLPQWHASLPDVEDVFASGLIPAANGVQIAKVKKIHEDKDGNYRVLVTLPSFTGTGQDDGIWARIAFPYASAEAGFFFFPEINDEVMLTFINNDPRYPVITGSLYSGKNKPKETPDEKNQYKSIFTKSGINIRFDDEDKILVIETPGGNSFTLDDKNKNIKVADLNKNSMLMDDQGITLDSPGDINIKSQKNVNIEATSNISLKATSDLKGEGLNIDMSAKTGFTAKGNASAELSASGQTTVKGAMVMIN
jgi:Rhs element Vgr protein